MGVGSSSLPGANTMSTDPRFSESEYATLLEWFMVSDPWPLAEVQNDRMEKMLNAEAVARGYDDWVHAYHEIHMEKAPQ